MPRHGSIPRICRICSAPFLGTRQAVEKGQALFCSAACLYESRRIPMADRFWKHVDKSGECWIWTASFQGWYGQIKSDGNSVIGAHRASWIIHNGPIPDGLWVLHRCDNPACVNPDHLFLGTHDDNMRDMAEKGRQGLVNHPERAPRGERNRHAKLSESDVLTIRTAHASGVGTTALSRQYGVYETTIADIVSRRTWKHI